MKNKLYIIAFCTLLVGLLSNFSKKTQKQVLLINGGDIPVLPNPMYDYSIDSLREVIEIDDAKATLGRVLFYDKKLSSTETISCASCHDHSLSFSDGNRFSEGLNGLTERNSLHLQDLSWGIPGRFSWDMQHESLQDMIRIPLNDDNEIGIDIDDVTDKLFNTIHYPTVSDCLSGTSGNRRENYRCLDAFHIFHDNRCKTAQHFWVA